MSVHYRLNFKGSWKPYYSSTLKIQNSKYPYFVVKCGLAWVTYQVDRLSVSLRTLRIQLTGHTVLQKFEGDKDC